MSGERYELDTTDVVDESLFLPRLEWLAAMDEEEFRRTFRGSAIKRTKWRGLVRNACIALGNSELHPGTITHQRIQKLLQRLASSDDAVIAESALWALSRIQ
jgi:epoxyqueuosine reductase